MANNKVQLSDGTVLLDLTGDTVTPETLLSGITAHNAAGNRINGAVAPVRYDVAQDLTSEQKKQARDNIGASATVTMRKVTLTVAGWGSSTKQQTVTVSGILADGTKQRVICSPVDESYDSAWNSCYVQCVGHGADSLTFQCDEIPTAAVEVYVSIQPVSFASKPRYSIRIFIGKSIFDFRAKKLGRQIRIYQRKRMANVGWQRYCFW